MRGCRYQPDTVGETLLPIRTQPICSHAGSIRGQCPAEVLEIRLSLFPQSVPPIPADTARVAHAAFPKGTLAIRVRDALGSISTDAAFADLVAPNGQPALAPWRLALVLVLQFVEGLSERALNRLELVIETLRAALNALATEAPFWLARVVSQEWYTRYRARAEESRLPTTERERQQLAAQIGQDVRLATRKRVFGTSDEPPPT